MVRPANKKYGVLKRDTLNYKFEMLTMINGYTLKAVLKHQLREVKLPKAILMPTFGRK